MTAAPPWDRYLSGTTYVAARELDLAARPPANPTKVARALTDAHLAGLDRTQITAVLQHARPHITPTELAAAIRRPPNLTGRPSFDENIEHDLTIVEDGPGHWACYQQLCEELRTRVDQHEITAPEYIDHAHHLAAGHDQTVAHIIAIGALIGAHTPDEAPMTMLRTSIALTMWHEAWGSP